MKYAKLIIVVFLFIIVLRPASANEAQPRGITLDGSIGTAGKLDLQGPDYDIRADYGQQAGANLFHSFQKFNLRSDESATFSGPDFVQNIVSRVTGGDASWIDGTLRSTIQGADMYFLNPAGVMFGANASLDIGGSFHVSTADFLRLGENERFYTLPLESDVLSASAPAAFGFLDGDAGKISAEGMGELSTDLWGEDFDNWRDWKNANPDFFSGLETPEGEAISMIGGDVEITGTFYHDPSNPLITNTPVGKSLSAPYGRISLAAVKSEGEVRLTESGVNVSAEQLGDIRVAEGAKLTVNSSGGETFPYVGRTGAGSVFVRGETFVLDSAQIASQAVAEDGQVIDIEADNVSLQNEARIAANTFGTGNGADVNIIASENFEITSKAKIFNGSFYTGNDKASDGGRLSITAKNISVSDYSRLGGEAYGQGKGGDIILDASESVHISDHAWLSTSATTWSTGQAGNISVKTPTLTLESLAKIKSQTEGAGEGGTVEIHTESLQITDGGEISVRTQGAGNAGNVTVSGPDPLSGKDLSSSVTLSGTGSAIRADATSKGKGGTVSIAAKELSLAENATIVTSASDTGNAGDIALQVGSLEIGKGASVASASKYPEAAVYTVPDVATLYGLTDAQEGDVAVVADAGDSTPGNFIKGKATWVQMTEKITVVADMAPLSDILFAMQAQTGGIVTVQNAGDGVPANFVYDGLFSWVKIQNVYTVSDLAQRDAFMALRGDVIRVENENGMTDHLTYTGEEWIRYQDIYSLADLSERNSLANLEKGDVAKVADAGNGNARSFIYDGNAWVGFYMTGNAGTISIRADGDVSLHDDATLTTASTGGMSAGKIDLHVSALRLRDEATVSSESASVGDAGSIAIHAEDSVTLENKASLTTATSGQGRGGDISLETSGLEMKDTAYISAASRATGNSGDAGTISIAADDTIFMRNHTSVRTSSEGLGNAGDISVSLTSLHVENGASISSASNASENGGAAGTIRISASDAIHLSGNSSLTTKAVNTVVLDESTDQLNGKISLYAGNLLDISYSEITTSVQSGLGNGGDISITSPLAESGQTAGVESVTLNHGKIVANAYEGRGGNIHIVTDQFIQSSDSIVEASSALGIDGTIRIEAPDEDVSTGLTLLPGNFLDATRWLKTPCSARIGQQQQVSRFALVGRDAMPTPPDDLQPSPLLGYADSSSDDALSQVSFRYPCPCFAFRYETEKEQNLMLPSDCCKD